MMIGKSDGNERIVLRLEIIWYQAFKLGFYFKNKKIHINLTSKVIKELLKLNY